MAQKFKLKKEVRHLFDTKYSEQIEDLKFWEAANFRTELLDKVDRIYVDYGHENISKEKYTATDLRGWSSVNNKAQFRFTINVLDMENRDYEKINMPEMMDEIQKMINNFIE